MRQLNIFIDTLIPYQNTANAIKDIIHQRIEEFRIHKTVSGIAGFIGLLLASSGLFSSMRTILNTIFKDFEEKNMMIGKLRDIGMTFIVLAFFLASMAILPALDISLNYLRKLEIFSIFQLEQISLNVISFLFSAFSFLIIFIMFFLIYYLIPYAKLDLRVIVLSAFIGSTLWTIAKEIFGYYIANVATISKVYGTYLFIVVVGFWIYYSSMILILSAEIAQLYREKMLKVKKHIPLN
jgi:YihY family inner membrane protein